MLYTLAQIRSEQDTGGSGIGPFEDEELSPLYERVEVAISSIKYPDPITGLFTLHSWKDYYRGVTVNGVLETGERDKATTQVLMMRYLLQLPMYPILLDTDGCIVDGLHRYAALNSLGRKTAIVYRPV